MEINFDYSIVSFADILGFSQMVECDSCQGIPYYLPNILTIMEDVAKVAQGVGVDLRLFSDCIVWATPYNLDAVINLFNIVRDTQRAFVKNGLIIRGGISFGKHFASEKIIFSKGLVTAYRLESEKARYPRIIIDENLINLLIGTSSEDILDQLDDLLLKDQDGAVFLNYVGDLIKEHESWIKQIIYHTPLDNPRVIQKMDWLIRFHKFISGGCLDDDFGIPCFGPWR